MKTTTKRIFALLVALVLCMSMFAACTKEEEPAPQQETTKAEETVEETAEEVVEEVVEPVTLEYYTWQAVTDTDENYLAEKVLTEYVGNNENVTINFNLVTDNDSTEFLKKMDLLLMSGEAVDVMPIPKAEEYVSRASQNILAPLDEYIAADETADVYSVSTEVNGSSYALPMSMAFWFVMLNKDMLDAAGLPTPPLDWTWDDYRDYSLKLTTGEGSDKVYGSYMHTWPQYKFFGVDMSSSYAPYLTEDGANNMDNPGFKVWLEFMNDLEQVDESQAPYFLAKSTSMHYRTAFFNGQAAMIPTGSWMIKEADDIEKYPHDFVTVFAPVPAFLDNPAGVSHGGCTYVTVPRQSKNKQEAYNFIKFMCSSAGHDIINSISVVKGADSTKVIGAQIELPEYYDIDSLLATIASPTFEIKAHTNVFPYSKAASGALNEEFEIFLVGGQTIDEAIENTKQRIDALIAEYSE